MAEKKSREAREKDRRMLLRLTGFVKPIGGKLAISCLSAAASIGCGLAGPEILGGLVQRLYDFWAAPDKEAGLAGSLVSGLLVLLAVYAAGQFFSYLREAVLDKATIGNFTCRLRMMIGAKIQRLPVSFADTTPVGEVLERMSDDVGKMGDAVFNIISTLMNGVLQISAIAVMMLLKDWRLALLVICVIPFSVLLSLKLSGLCLDYFKETNDEYGKLTALVEESYANFATTKAYNLEGYNSSRHEGHNRRMQKAEAKGTFLESVVQPVITFINALSYILINLLGGWLIITGRADVGSIVTIVLFARQIASPLEEVAFGVSFVSRATAAAGRVFALLDKEEEQSAAGTVDPEKVEGRVEFRDVSFSYDKDKPLIEHLDIRVEPGQKVAIVGPTGAGKTTLVNLLMRFYDVDGGSILVDGTDLASVSRDSSRTLFGMVLQDTWIFKGTIAENVAYGRPDATREEIVRACDEAYCDHFIRTLPKGYDTEIGEDNAAISGGQKQLLTIARALLANRGLLILDEATSNVDTRTELLIQKAMDKLMRGRTTFVIAHRLSTIVDADVILVLNDGRIVEQGRHSDLLEKKGFYYKLYTSQYAGA